MAHCSLCAASCVHTERTGQCCGRQSEPWLRAPLSQSSNSWTKRASSSYKDDHKRGKRHLEVQGATAAATGQSRRPPPSGPSGYYTENAMERPALRHLGANQLSGRLANFFFPLVALAVNQSFTQPLLEVVSITLGKPRITCLCPSLSFAPLARLCV